MSALARRRLLVALPFLWLAVFFLLPFAIVLKIALAQSVIAVPPYTPLFAGAPDGGWRFAGSLENFRLLADDPVYAHAVLNALRLAAIATAIALPIGFAMAYVMARARPSLRNLLLLLAILPFWTSFLLRVYAWKVLLQQNGVLNDMALALGLVERPLPLLYTEGALLVGLVYSYLPFMVLPLYATLEKLDPALLEAAADLGSRPWRTFLTVTLPLSAPGILAGSLLVFIPAVGEFVIPELLGGPDAVMIGRLLWTEFSQNRDWPVAAAIAVVMLVLLVAPIALFQRQVAERRERGA